MSENIPVIAFFLFMLGMVGVLAYNDNVRTRERVECQTKMAQYHYNVDEIKRLCN